MKGISYVFFVAAAICGLIGMGWGIQMSATADHSLSPAHAHLNLLGWVSLSIFGVAYHLVPTAGESILAKIHAGLSIAGVIIIVPGIVMAIRETAEPLAKLGSVLCVAGMLVFLFVLLTKMRSK
jgi:drug/metabolite transporter superfamily protein YnfA